MQRTLPGLIALAAAGVLAAGAVMAQPPHQAPAPPPPHATRPAPKQVAAPPPRQPNSLGADWRLQQDEAAELRRQRRIMPLGRVIEQINARSPGRQLDAGLEYQGARPIYRVRWMTRNGRRVDYLIDAATGAILSGS
jgi:Peptidase propeptide and YPEB domain